MLGPHLSVVGRGLVRGLLWDLSLAFQSRQHLFVDLGRGHDDHGPDVLRGGPQHRWSADVYLFDDLRLGSAPGDSVFEGIEVDADQVYRADILLDELLYVVRVSEVG